jgi:hypothetical protein
MKFYNHKNPSNNFDVAPCRIEHGPGPNGKILILFYKEDKLHNAKNAAIYIEGGKKGFFLKDEFYFRNFRGKQFLFNSEENFFKKNIDKNYWRRFVKMQVFK